MTKNAWILVNRYCLTFNIYRPFLVDSSEKKYIYYRIYSIKSESTLLGVLSYGYPMGMIWLSYGINSQLPYTTQYSLLNTQLSSRGYIVSYHTLYILSIYPVILILAFYRSVYY